MLNIINFHVMRGRKLVSLNDLIYCFNQIPLLKLSGEIDEEVRVILPHVLGIDDGLELQDSLLFQRIGDSNKFKLRTLIDIVSP